MKKWTRTETHKISNHLVPGIYSATTELGRKIYTFSNSSEEAYGNLITGVSFSDKIKFISRVTSNEH